MTKLHCCIRTDGGGAIVLTSEERAGDCERVGGLHRVAVRPLRELAFERAGVTPAEIDTLQAYDAFTPMVILTLEEFGFCEKGEGGSFVEHGALHVDGELPTNTDGGGLSACQPGMREMFLLIEEVKQLRNECGARQVPGASLACVNGTCGWFTAAGTVILGNDRPDCPPGSGAP